MKKEVTKEKALERLQGLCSRSEQCEFDIERKMINWGLFSHDRKDIMSSLRDNNFVNEARYAKSFANDKARFSFWGPNKIKVELIKKRIKSMYIKEALTNVEQNTWKEGLLRVALSKSKNLDLIGEDEWANKQKLFRYIISRGFPSSAASKAVALMKRKQEENTDD